jgi:hypothetical protein
MCSAAARSILACTRRQAGQAGRNDCVPKATTTDYAATTQRRQRTRSTGERGLGMNRAERIGFWMYVAMGVVCVAVLVAAAISAIAS